MSFTKIKESFICENCDQAVTGNGFTNHCPACLWSKHVDVDPGDRLATCRGLMPPIAVRYLGGEFTIYQQCQRCGFKRSCRSSPKDDNETLIQLTAIPLPED